MSTLYSNRRYLPWTPRFSQKYPEKGGYSEKGVPFKQEKQTRDKHDVGAIPYGQGLRVQIRGAYDFC